jgi:hypothetical protein
MPRLSRKKRDQATRPAFKSVNSAAVASAVEHEVPNQGKMKSLPPVFAFKGQAMVQVEVQVKADKVEVGFTTALVACVISHSVSGTALYE